MLETNLTTGIVLGFGGTNARFGVARQGEIYDFSSVTTPEQPKEFFGWMARHVLHAADKGHGWLVSGFPGPVSPDGKYVGPMANISGLSAQRYNLAEELSVSDPAVGRLIDEGFSIVAVNDGELAAQAGAIRVGNSRYDKTAALILGTGVGAGVVIKDPGFSNVYRADRTNPTEIGHVLLSADPFDTFENSVSGPALKRHYNLDAQELTASHPAWKRVGETAGRLITLLGLMNGVELVVPCGGVGAGASEKYGPHLTNLINDFRDHGNDTQKLFLPDVAYVPKQDMQVFELFGGEAVMRDFQTRG